MPKECISYVVADDCGYAPNPWFESCTLAVCKPVIRKTAKPGDWVIGLTPKHLGFRLVYAMAVGEVLSLGDYFFDPRFSVKKPDFSSDDVRLWMGDNFYEPTGTGYVQHVSAHNYADRDEAGLRAKAVTDLSGKNVLISDEFFYYGDQSPLLPRELGFLEIGRGHRCSGESGALVFEEKAAHLIREPGIHGDPRQLENEAGRLAYLHEWVSQTGGLDVDL